MWNWSEDLKQYLMDTKSYYLMWKRIPNGMYLRGQNTANNPRGILLRCDAKQVTKI